MQDAALEVFSSIDHMSHFSAVVRQEMGEWKEKSRLKFLSLSDSDVDGLWQMIWSLDKAWNNLYRGSATPLREARELLDSWHGGAANAAKSYIENLSQDYERTSSAVSVLESDVVAAREAIGKARTDLSNLSNTLKTAAEQWMVTEAAESSSAMEVLAAGFSAGLSALLAVPAGDGSPPGRGAVEVTSAAGSVTLEGMKPANTSVAGTSPEEIFQDFMDSATQLQESVQESMAELIREINLHMNEKLPELADPPDLSSRGSFHPDRLGTDRLPEETEDNVREDGKDIPQSTPGEPGGAGGRSMSAGTGEWAGGRVPGGSGEWAGGRVPGGSGGWAGGLVPGGSGEWAGGPASGESEGADRKV